MMRYLPILIAAAAVVALWTPLVLYRATGRAKLFPSDSTLELLAYGLSVPVLGAAIGAAYYGLTPSGYVLVALTAVIAGIQFLVSTPPAKVAQMRMRIVGLKAAKREREIIGSYRLLRDFEGELATLKSEKSGFAKLHVFWLAGEVQRRLAALQAKGDGFVRAVAKVCQEEGKFGEATQYFEQIGDVVDAAVCAIENLEIERAMTLVINARPENVDAVFAALDRRTLFDEATRLAEAYRDYTRLTTYYQRTERFLDAARLLEHQLKRIDDAADVYFKAEAWDDALRLYQELGEDERVADIAYARGEFAAAGEAYERLGLTERAADAYEKGGLHERAALLFRHEGQFDAAAKSFTAVMDYKKTAEMYTRIKEFDKSAEAYELSGDYRNAVDHYALAGMWEKAADTAARGQLYDKAGDIYLNLERFTDAGRMYELSNNSSRAGDCYQKAGDWERAGDCYARTGALSKAEQMYAKVGAHPKCGQMFESARRFAEAARYYQQAGDTVAAARCLSQGGDPLEAARAMEGNGDFAGAGEMYEQAGEFDEAVRVFERGELYQRAADVVLTRLSDPDRAALLYEKAGCCAEAGRIYLEQKKYAQAGRVFELAGEHLQAGEAFRKAGDPDKALENYDRCGEYAAAAEMFIDKRDTSRAVHFLLRAERLEASFESLDLLSFDDVLKQVAEQGAPDSAVLYALHHLSRRPALVERLHGKLKQLQNQARERMTSLRSAHVELILSYWARNYPEFRSRLARLTEELEIQVVTSGTPDEQLTVLGSLFPYFAGLCVAEGASAALLEKVGYYFEQHLELSGGRPPSSEVARHTFTVRVLNGAFDAAQAVLPLVDRAGDTKLATYLGQLLEGLRRGRIVDSVFSFRETLRGDLQQVLEQRISEWRDVEDLSRTVYNPERILVELLEEEHLHRDSFDADFRRRVKEAQDRLKIASRSDRRRDAEAALQAIGQLKRHRRVLELSESELRDYYWAAASLCPLADPSGVERANLAAEYQLVFGGPLPENPGGAT
ncbi:MAG: hypothetical protein KC609_09425 [Myxococcales bacterium]|nr:hypothetical protein [Myxococcales bacterium]